MFDTLSCAGAGGNVLAAVAEVEAAQTAAERLRENAAAAAAKTTSAGTAPEPSAKDGAGPISDVGIATAAQRSRLSVGAQVLTCSVCFRSRGKGLSPNLSLLRSTFQPVFLFSSLRTINLPLHISIFIRNSTSFIAGAPILACRRLSDQRGSSSQF